MINKQVVLHCATGGSDKVYKLQLVPAPEDASQWVVNFHYGRRVIGPGFLIQGNNGGTKTETPQPYAGALEIYENQIVQQERKQYRIVESSQGDMCDPVPVSVSGPAKPRSGHDPMLLREVKDEEQALQLCQNPSYCAQEKQDGERRLLEKSGDGYTRGINRKGEFVELPQAVRNSTEGLYMNKYLLDGEIIGDVLRVWDILRKNDSDLIDMPMRSRYELLRLECGGSGSIKAIPTAFTTAAKQALFAEVKARGGEGIVFKLVAAPYQPGKSKYALKWKFKADATVRVLSISKAKRSVQIAVVDQSENVVLVGNVTIPINREVPSVSSLCDVEYLYYFEGGSLFQPVYKGPRVDKDSPDLLSSLKRKPVNIDDELEDEQENAA